MELVNAIAMFGYTVIFGIIGVISLSQFNMRMVERFQDLNWKFSQIYLNIDNVFPKKEK